LEISRNAFWWRGAILSSRLAQVCSTRAKAFSPGKRDCFAIWKKASRQKIFRVGKIAAYQTTARRDRSVIPANTPHTTPLYNTKMACIASTFTGSVAALKASKVQVRRATRARARACEFRRDRTPVLSGSYRERERRERARGGRARRARGA
jgi:hypothetical protein